MMATLAPDRTAPATRPRVVLAFAAAGSPWVLDTYDPLQGKFDIRMLTANRHAAAPWTRRVATTAGRLEALPATLRVAAGQLMLRCWPDWDRIRGLKRQLEDADIVHTVETNSGASLQAARLKRKMGFRHVVTVWENIAHRLRRHPRIAAVKRQVLESADRFIAISDRARTALLLEGIAAPKISVIPPGIRVAPPAARCRPHGRRRFELLFAGKKQRSKGMSELLSALYLAKQDPALRHLDLRLTCLGVRPSRGPYATLIGKYGLEKSLREIDFVPHHEVLDYYRNSDALVVPSRVTPLWQEQWGMVFMEAMSQGLPIIASASGSISEVTRGAALLCHPNDHHSLYQRIAELALCNDLWDNLSTRGRELAEQEYAAPKIAERIGAVYRDLLKCGAERRDR